MTPLALIIEDDKHLAYLFTHTLQRAGFDTETIQDGRLALTRLTKIRPDIIILDLHLPHVSGRDILHWIRIEPQLSNSQIIVVTADEAMADELFGQADITLIKPIRLSHLQDLASLLCSRNGGES